MNSLEKKRCLPLFFFQIKDIKDNVPSKWYKYFIEILLVTIQTEIGECSYLFAKGRFC